MTSSTQHHRSTYKHVNKAFKGKSKGKAARKHGAGRSADIKQATVHNNAAHSTHNTHHSNAQQRRRQLIEQQRISRSHAPPRNIILFTLDSTASSHSLAEQWSKYAERIGKGMYSGALLVHVVTLMIYIE